MSTVTPNLGLFKYDTTNVTDLASAFNINTALNNNWDKIDEAISNSGGARNIGEIVTSTVPLTDAGLHLLDGALIQGSGIYSDFVNYIAGLYDDTDTPNYFTDENTWQQSITDYGVCGKFVYDTTNNAVRLPKITGIIEGTTDLTALGDLVEAGLPSLELYTPKSTVRYGSQVNKVYNTDSTSGSSNNIISTNINSPALYIKDANNIVGNSSTVQPQTVKVLYYIVIGTNVKTDIQVDIDNIATDLNSKADIDLTNTTNQAKILMSGMGMPSDRYVGLTVGASGSAYTAPANGWFWINVGFSNTSGTVRLISPALSIRGNANAGAAASVPVSVYIPILKNQDVVVEYANVKTFYIFGFIPAVGSESEVS